MITALVTGSNGYVGQVLVETLLKKKVLITALDIQQNMAIQDNNIEFISIDLIKSEEVKKRLAGKKFDWIFHVASLANDTGSPKQMVDVNICGLLNVLNFARECNPKRVVVVSSLSACGWYPATPFEKPEYLPVDENYPCKPKDMYCVTKRMQEMLSLTFYYQYKLPVACVRLTAVVGPKGQGGGSGYREIAKAMKEGKSVQIPHFSAQEVCHYVDIRDVARMMITCAENDKATGEIFNCCGPQKTSGKEFADIMKKVVPGIEVTYDFPWSMAQGNVIYYSMEKAKSLLAFEPKYSIEDSIRSIKEWIDSGGLEEKTGREVNFVKGVDKF